MPIFRTALAAKVINDLNIPHLIDANLEYLKRLLLEEVKLSSGCTEIAAVGYAVSQAKEMAVPPYKIKLYMDLDVFKNAAAVGVPNGGFGIIEGIRKALLSKPSGLETLSNSEGIYEDKVDVEIVPIDLPYLFIYAVINDGSALIAQRHDNLIYTGKPLDLKEAIEASKKEAETSLLNGIYDKTSKNVKLYYRDLVIYSEGLLSDAEIRGLIEKAIKYNTSLSEENLSSDRFFGIARNMSSSTFEDRIVRFTSAAVEARMGGSKISAMSVAGSGNQGIISTLPIVAYSKEKGLDKASTYRAILLAWLTTIYSTAFTKYVSPVCGAGIKAGNGLAASFGFLFGNGSYDVIESSIINNIASVSGMLCDGAKPACALKAAVGVNSAYRSALLASHGIRVSPLEGIAGKTLEESLINLGEYVDKASQTINSTLVNIINKKLKTLSNM
ncbi:MAG: L-serine ammonia-lyase, iron-sulfur-dependent, subunit alpha [Nitrososphaeria archaeon]